MDIEEISGTKLTDLKMSYDSSIPEHSFCSYQWQADDSISIKAIAGNFHQEQYYHIGLSELSSITDD